MTSLRLVTLVCALERVAVGAGGTLAAPESRARPLAEELHSFDVHCFDQECGADLKAVRKADPKGAALFDCMRYSTHKSGCLAGKKATDLSQEQRKLMACGMSNDCVKMRTSA